MNDPQTGGMPGDVEVQNAPTVMADDEETIEHAECDCRDREEVHRRDGFPMIPHERKPSLGWLRISGCPAHPSGNGTLRDIETEHEKLTVDARRSPGRVSATIWKIRSRTSFEILFLPIARRALDIARQ
ncbi:MAG: hypothetical protein WA405_13640 [Candidatus Acidiferrales bacterium]